MEVEELSKNIALEAKLASETNLASFSVDLLKASLNELDFLAAIDAFDGGRLYEEKAVKRAVFRYEKYWLPFLTAQTVPAAAAAAAAGGAAEDGAAGGGGTGQADDLAPPLDIHWVWHVHMLAPVFYAQVTTVYYTALKVYNTYTVTPI